MPETSPVTADLGLLADMARESFLGRYSSRLTVEQYTIDLAQWFAWCAARNLPVLEARRAHLELYVRHCETKFKPKTTARRVGTVCGFYRLAVADDLIVRDPALYVRRPKQPDESQTLGLSHLQFEAVLVESRKRPTDHALIALLGLCGLRVSEACALQVGDLDFVHGHRTIRFVGKGDKPALVPLSPLVARGVDDARGQRTDGPLLRGRDGQPLDRKSAGRIVHRVCRRAGVTQRITPHSLRHTYVTTLLDAGVPLRDVQIAARHSDPRTTTRYDRARNVLDRHANYQLSAFMAGAA